MTIQNIHKLLLDQFGSSDITGHQFDAIDPWIEVAPEAIARVAEFLKSRPELAFDHLCNLCGVDYLETDPKLAAKFPYDVHLEVVYHLHSLKNKHRLTLKVKLPRWKNDVPGQLPEVPTVSHIWGIADWHERETYDLVGVNFIGHPNLVRILCPDDWEGHPLRKDYDFPLEYHGIRGK